MTDSPDGATSGVPRHAPRSPIDAPLRGLTTALHLAAVELQLTTDAVRWATSLQNDPARVVVLVQLLEGVGTHLGFAAQGTERVLALLSDDDKGKRT